LRDFLLVYNRMTELCFRHCVSNLNYRLLTGREVRHGPGPRCRRATGAPGRPDPPLPQERCLDSCAGKLVHSNHRLMSAYVALMPSIMQRRISDYEASVAPASQDSAPAGTAVPTALPGAGGPPASPDPPAGPAAPSQGAPGTGT
ncbi:T10B translocase, partial [Anhinga anhinga]|nr:T10B translocase [Anhinga anhinga]